tara:strand:- start:4740 stop:5621 length:882 start_codon:yes stop_codon:yes gene_type:complete
MLTKNLEKIPNNYICVFCDYNTSNKKDFNKHLLTDKHKMLSNVDKEIPKIPIKEFTCECGKKYKHRQSLSVHKKKCNFNNLKTEKIKIDNDNIGENDLEYKSMFVTMMKENEELRKQVTDLLPKVGNTTNNTFNNTVNQNLNINVFLNEKCKDALNMSDFIKSIEITLEQLDLTKKNGLVDGLSNAIVEKMNKLSLYERPLHCVDLKHETLYIKENNKWEMDDNKEKIKCVIKKVSNKNYGALQNWKEQNPDFKEDDTKKEYFVQSLSNISKDSKEIDNNKIIKNICENVFIK